ncbi:uncharacterized protein LOC8275540 isoform X2 [Ricinus communis]|uniref:uncharacterized protein LOC8275540 isoform X2 n=1 Tax=Ricinus communis TaxID=3988 RepID=UPI000D691A8E|nr:uncharacterized protein LOC8275540 isoform X2 [Ricinus communis]|eukprot:XP_025013084.1 uncharacterized protein LOC8275540 isoform X3 [Ricinus communis]
METDKRGFMGTFVGHFVPALALILLGLWHTINTVRAYCLKGSTSFNAKFWYPFYGFTLFTEITHSSEILSGVSGILASSVFGQELFLLHFHSTDHVGLEGHYHWLLQLIVFVSLVSALAATNFPSSFPAALVLSISVVFQGCWFMNMGFMLWVPNLIPEGCVMQLSEANTYGMHGAVTCGSIDADLRARALANLQFSWILAAILLFTGGACLKSAGRCTSRVQSIEYEQLHNKGANCNLTCIVKRISPAK